MTDTAAYPTGEENIYRGHSARTVSWPTALGIPCPRKGAETEERPLRYRLWFRLYKTVRVARHRFGFCDWRTVYACPGPTRYDKCDWCGATRKVHEL